ncbi:MAG: sugar phosphate isomerase/epimerase [Gemmataceae bacterium]|nr:sugar phosphate isomerase/epimerase [Gemmataceae bacterium]MDW8263915.1 sugar phosphate isomerase/epimerase [Gemmataceae bacterium]
MKRIGLLSRRGFLEAGAAAAFGWAVAPATAQAAADPFGGFIVGVQSFSFRNFDLEQALKRTQDLGLRYAEFYQKHVPLNSTPDQLRSILKLCREYDVTPIAFGVQRFTKDHAANQKLFEFGKALGIRTFSADPDPDSFDSLDKLCEEYKISIAIHPHGPTGKGTLHRWYSAEVILAAVKDHHPLIGSCLDTGHLIRAEQLGKKLDPAAQVRVMGARNFGMHLKDHDNARKTDVVYGKGALDVPAVLRALREVKFQGYISIEYEANPQEPSPDIKACVEVFKEAVKKLA